MMRSPQSHPDATSTHTGPGPYLPKPHVMYKMLEASCSPSRPSLITCPDNAHHRAVRAATAPCFSVSNLKQVSWGTAGVPTVA
jgi:hypothetical protein